MKLLKPDEEEVSAEQESSAQGSRPKIKPTSAKVPAAGAEQGSLHRVLLIRGKRENDTWRYGFAEFHTVADAQAALARYESLERFTISSKPVVVSYVHSGVFKPVMPMMKKGNPAERHTFASAINPAQKLYYWDRSAYASELVVSENAPVASECTPATKEESPVNADNESKSKMKKRKAEPSEAPVKKKVAVPAIFDKWHAIASGQPTEPLVAEANSQMPETANSTAEARRTASPVTAVASFRHPKKLACLLCLREFKSEEQLDQHEKVSALHKTNLADADKKAKALAKIEAAGGAPAPPLSSYRDRAAERREAFSFTLKPAASRPTPSVEEPEKEKPASKNRGAALLGKMGWKEGSGLGARGEGLVGPIQTDAYIPGVGLGAVGGKIGDAVHEASRNTAGGREAFLERAKDSARERFYQME